MQRLTALLTALALAAVLAACSQEEELSIAAIAAGDAKFSTLVAALTKADLFDTLDSDAGPFTVFAPTDIAFQALLDDLGLTAAELLALDNLADILKLHVVEGAVSRAEAIQAVSTRSLGQELLFFIVEDGDLKVDGVAFVSGADIEATNGVIHVIDSVLLPKGTIADAVVARATATVDPQFETLLTAILAANEAVLDTLGNVAAGPFTVFAPTDLAFAALGDALNDLVGDEAALTDVLLYHATAAGALLASQVLALVAGGAVDVEMLNGDDVSVDFDGSNVTVNTAKVVFPNVLTANGVIHVIDAVLLPPTP